MKKDLTKSLEMYLLAIDNLLETKELVMVKDVAKILGYGGASAADAIKKLRDKGYVNYEPYGNISLTTLGKNTITVKKYRHSTITKFLNKVLDIAEDKAEENANALEYSMTEDVLSRLVNFMDFMEQCSCAEPKWVKSCKSSLSDGKISQKCKTCSGGCCCSEK